MIEWETFVAGNLLMDLAIGVFALGLAKSQYDKKKRRGDIEADMMSSRPSEAVKTGKGSYVVQLREDFLELIDLNTGKVLRRAEITSPFDPLRGYLLWSILVLFVSGGVLEFLGILGIPLF